MRRPTLSEVAVIAWVMVLAAMLCLPTLAKDPQPPLHIFFAAGRSASCTDRAFDHSLARSPLAHRAKRFIDELIQLIGFRAASFHDPLPRHGGAW
jgi:hypothetical protein